MPYDLLDHKAMARYDRRKLAKWKSQRLRQGFADIDAWNFDIHLLEVISLGLRTLAENTHTYPGNEEFPTYKDWTEWLRGMAQKSEDIMHLICDSTATTRAELEADAEKCNQLLNELFEGLRRNFLHLWD